MAVWRAFYATYLDIYNFRTAAGTKLDRDKETQHFADSLKSAVILALGGCVVIEVLNNMVGEERLEALVSSLIHHSTTATLPFS